ncbi:MAG: ADOP family duplicated permease [Acidobacteriota bacterium]
MLERLVHDIRLAFRSLARQPGYAVATVLTLALGVGANTATFSLIDGILLAPLPYADGDELVMLRQGTEGIENFAFSIAEFDQLDTSLDTLDLVEYHAMSFVLLGGEEPLRVSTGVVSHDFFDLLGVTPAIGRNFTDTDERHGAEAVLLLSHRFWASLGADPDVVGRRFEMNDKPHTVVGVLPPLPPFPADHDVYMPTIACPFRAAGEGQKHENRGAFRGLSIFGRLAGQSSSHRADAEVATVGRSFLVDHPEIYEGSSGYRLRTRPLLDELTRDARPALGLLLAATGLVLLLACANIANLALNRALRRRREMAVRASLGADRGELTRLASVEAAVLAVVGAGLGVLVAGGGLDLLKHVAARATPRAESVSLDLGVLAFAIGLALVTAWLATVLPAIRERPDLASSLRQGDRGTDDRRSLRLRGVLVAVQVAVAVVLLAGAGLLIRSFVALQEVDPGFDEQDVITAQVPLNWSRLGNRDDAYTFYQRALERLRAHPAVLHAAAGSVAPLTQQGSATSGIVIEGMGDDDAPPPNVDVEFITPDFFRVLEVPLLRGRRFDTRDHGEAAGVAIINASLAERFFGDVDPIGRRLSLDARQTWLEVVGVVGDVRHDRLDRAASDEVYRPLAQAGMSFRLLVRHRPGARGVATAIREAVYGADAQQPVERIEAMAVTRRASLDTPRASSLLLSLFAALALGITAVGVGGVVAYSISQRTREIGVRMALGARTGHVLGMVLRQGLGMIVGGLVVGLAGALVFGRLLSDLLFEVGAHDPLTLVLVVTVLLITGVLACIVPARRAVGVEASIALRSD